MYDTRKDLLDALEAGPEILRAILRDCTQEQARNARGGDEDWSVVEVVCHLRDAEERALHRTVAMRDEVEPFLPGYDQDEWARERNYASADLRQAMDDFVRFRQEHDAVIRAMSNEDLERTGRHEEQGVITIAAQGWHMAAHDAQHAAQIARQLGS